jgi:hypothetical protein
MYNRLNRRLAVTDGAASWAGALNGIAIGC